MADAGDTNQPTTRQEAGFGCPLHVATDELLADPQDPATAAAVTAKCFALATRDPEWAAFGRALALAAHDCSPAAQSHIRALLRGGNETTGEAAVANDAETSSVGRSLLTYSQALQKARLQQTPPSQAYQAAYVLADELHQIYAPEPLNYRAALAAELTHTQRHSYTGSTETVGAPFKSLRRKLSKAKRSAGKRIRKIRGSGGVSAEGVAEFKRVNPVTDRVYLQPGSIRIPYAVDTVADDRDRRVQAYAVAYLFVDPEELSATSQRFNSTASLNMDFNVAFPGDGARNAGSFDSFLNASSIGSPADAWPLAYYSRRTGKMKRRRRLGTVFVWLVNRNATDDVDDYTLRSVAGKPLSVQASLNVQGADGARATPAVRTHFGGRLVLSGGKPGTLTKWMSQAKKRVGDEMQFGGDEAAEAVGAEPGVYDDAGANNDDAAAIPPPPRTADDSAPGFRAVGRGESARDLLVNGGGGMAAAPAGVASVGGMDAIVQRSAERQYKRLLTGEAVSYRVESRTSNQMLVLTFTRHSNTASDMPANRYWFRLESAAVFVSDKEPVRNHF